MYMISWSYANPVSSVSLQAADPMGFPDSVCYEVEGNICREEGPLPDCFPKPRAIMSEPSSTSILYAPKQRRLCGDCSHVLARLSLGYLPMQISIKISCLAYMFSWSYANPVSCVCRYFSLQAADPMGFPDS